MIWQNIISTSPRIFCSRSIIRRKYKRPWHQNIFSDTFVFHFCVKILLEISSTWCRKIKINSPIKDKFYTPLCTEMRRAVRVRKRYMSCDGPSLRVRKRYIEVRVQKIYEMWGYKKDLWAVRVRKRYLSCEGTKKIFWSEVQKIYEGTKKIQLTRWQEAGGAALLNTRWL